jgi:hypothetical protein
MILTSPSGLHYPDHRIQVRDGKEYLICETVAIMDGRKSVGTLYIVKNDKNEYREMTPEMLYKFFML